MDACSSVRPLAIDSEHACTIKCTHVYVYIYAHTCVRSEPCTCTYVLHAHVMDVYVIEELCELMNCNIINMIAH